MKKLVISLFLLLVMTTSSLAMLTEKASIRKTITSSDVDILDLAKGGGKLNMYYTIQDMNKTAEVEEILQTQGNIKILGKDSDGERVWKTLGWHNGELIENTATTLEFSFEDDDEIYTVTYNKVTEEVIIDGCDISLVLN